MVLREQHIYGSSGIIRANDLMPLWEGFSAVIIKQVEEALPHRITVDDLYEDLQFAQRRVERLMQHQVCEAIPPSSLTGKIYFGKIYQPDINALAIHPDTISRSWEGRQDLEEGIIVWQEVPVQKPVVLSQQRLETMEAQRHRPS